MKKTWARPKKICGPRLQVCRTRTWACACWAQERLGMRDANGVLATAAGLLRAEDDGGADGDGEGEGEKMVVDCRRGDFVKRNLFVEEILE